MADNLEAVEARHHHIQDQDVEVIVESGRNGSIPVVDDLHDVSFAFEPSLHDAGQADVVFSD